MTPNEVKDLVKMQLETRKPIRAPWYRPAGCATPGSDAHVAANSQQQQVR